MSEFAVKGLKELQAYLSELPAQMEAKIMRGALRAGADVILQDAKARVPVAPPNAENARLYGGYAGALRDSLRLSTRLKNGAVTATIRAGGKKGGADTYYARFVEYGTAMHEILPKSAKALFLGHGKFSEGVTHPGAQAKPFMRPAMYGRAGDAVVAVGEKIKERLAKGGNALAGEIEVDIA